MTLVNTSGVWRPREKPFRTLVIKSSLFALGNALETASILDSEIKREIKNWKEPFSILFEVLPKGPYMVLEKRGGILRFGGMKKKPCDLTISFKTIEGAFLVMSGQIGTAQSYAESRATLKGDSTQAMSLIRCMNLVQFYLFPGIVAKRVLKRMPKLTPRRALIRAAIMGIGLPVQIVREIRASR